MEKTRFIECSSTWNINKTWSIALFLLLLYSTKTFAFQSAYQTCTNCIVCTELRTKTRSEICASWNQCDTSGTWKPVEKINCERKFYAKTIDTKNPLTLDSQQSQIIPYFRVVGQNHRVLISYNDNHLITRGRFVPELGYYSGNRWGSYLTCFAVARITGTRRERTAAGITVAATTAWCW